MRLVNQLPVVGFFLDSTVAKSVSIMLFSRLNMIVGLLKLDF